MAQMRSVHGEGVKGAPVVSKARDDEGATHLLARQSTEVEDLEGLDLQVGEEPEAPLTALDQGMRIAKRSLGTGEVTVLGEVEPPFAREVGEQGLPPGGSVAGGDALGARERDEAPLDAQGPLQLLDEILSIVAAPDLGADEEVGGEPDQGLERSGGASPPIHPRVEVEGHDAHPATLRSHPLAVWQGLRVDSVSVAFGHRLWWVDAFIGDGERGNPAVVVLLERPMLDADLQQIAFELGVSETAFVRRVGDGWSLRWFTPTVEVDLCGHATLATLHVLLNELGVPHGEFQFQTRAGVLTGRRLAEGLLGVDLPRSYVEPVDVAVLGDTLGPVKEAYQAGASSVIAVIEDYDTLCGLTVDTLGMFLVPASLVIAVCEGGPRVDASIRVFAPRLGLAEDPVTGSAMCAVAPWWAARTGSPVMSVRQASARGGIMHSRLFERNVEVAGLTRTFFGGDLRA